MKHLSVWQFAWGAWAGSAITGFVLLERAALRSYRHPTLSTTLRWTLGVQPEHAWRIPALGLTTMLWIWLTVHLARAPEDVYWGPCAPGEGWRQVQTNLWYRYPRRHSLI